MKTHSYSRAVLLLFVASGASGLLFSAVWIRLLSDAFGRSPSTLLSSGTVVLAGLALGSRWGGRVLARVANPLRGFGFLHAVLGVYALGVPVFLGALTPLDSYLYPALETTPWALSLVRFLLSALLLLPPLFLLGATFPFLTGHLERHPGPVRRSIAELYAAGAGGAFLGAMLGGFFLLPGVGLTRTLMVGALLDLAVAGAAVALARQPGVREDDSSDADAAAAPGAAPLPRPLLLTATGVLGFTALALFSLWTRTLALALGPTADTRTVLLSLFLLGVTSGSLAASRWLRRPDRAARAFEVAPAAMGLLAVAGVVWLDRAPDFYEALVGNGQGAWPTSVFAKLLIGAIPVLPPTFFFGAALPLAVGADRTARTPSRSVGDLFGVMVAGGIAGHALAAFTLIPLLGARASLEIVASVSVLASAAVLLTGDERRVARRSLGAVSLALLVTGVVALPDWRESVRIGNGFALGDPIAAREDARPGHELLFLAEEATSTVTVHQWRDQRSLRRDGATVAGSVLAAVIPLATHENPRDVAVLGLGTGLTTAAVGRHPAVESIECVAPSRGNVRAARLFEESNRGILDDPRVRTIVADGRNHLLRSGRIYDVIVVRPEGLWTARGSSWTTLESFSAGAARLRPGGILALSLDVRLLSPELLRPVLAAAESSFANVSLWLGGPGELLLLAGDESARLDVERFGRQSGAPADRELLVSADVADLPSLLSRNLLAGSYVDRYVGEALPGTDDRNSLEFAVPRLFQHDSIRELLPGLHAAAGGVEELAGLDSTEIGMIERGRNARALQTQARFEIGEGRLEEGLATLEEAMRSLPTAPDLQREFSAAMVAQGRVLFERGETPDAIRLHQRAAALDPSSGQPHFELARIFGETSRLELARRAIDEAIRREPDDPRLLTERASIANRTHDPARARTDGLKALEIDSWLLRPYLELGRAQETLTLFDQAESTYVLGLTHFPTSDELRSAMREVGTRPRESRE